MSPDSNAAARDHAGRLTVDLGALARNWAHLARLSDSSAECAAVVKANGYGLGVERVAGALWNEGARTFFVAHLSEGEALRRAVPEAVIYVLNGLPPGAAPRYIAADLRPVLGAWEDWREWAGAGPAALHIDTGMNRLGFDMADADALANDDLGNVSLLMTHLACADVADHPLTAQQVERFAALTGKFPGVPASLLNSAGILRGLPAYALTRPGIALYGASALSEPSALETVATLRVPVIQTRLVKAGETVGYGAAWAAARDTPIALLSCGYADGFLRAAGSTDSVPGHTAFHDDAPLPLIGRISMDIIAVDMTAAPELARGGWVEMLGASAHVDAAAKAAGTIGYELLTGLGARYAVHEVR